MLKSFMLAEDREYKSLQDRQCEGVCIVLKWSNNSSSIVHTTSDI